MNPKYLELQWWPLFFFHQIIHAFVVCVFILTTYRRKQQSIRDTYHQESRLKTSYTLDILSIRCWCLCHLPKPLLQPWFGFRRDHWWNRVFWNKTSAEHPNLALKMYDATIRKDGFHAQCLNLPLMTQSLTNGIFSLKGTSYHYTTNIDHVKTIGCGC